MEDLPKTWQIKKVSDLMTEVKDRIVPTESNATNYVGLEHIQSYGKLIGRGDSNDVKSTKTVFKTNDVLYAKLRPYLNKHVVANFDGVCSTDILVYRNPNTNTSKLFNYWLDLESSIKLINAEAKGINLPRVSASILNSFEIPVPPDNELSSIIAKLDTLFAHLDQLKARLQNIPTLLKQFRQAVLTQAVTGKLNDGQLKLFTIEHLTNFIGSGVTPRGGNENYFKEGIPFIRSMNVYPEGLYLENLAFITKEMHDDMSRSKIKDKDVLLNITGASIGRATYIPQGFGEGNVNQHVCILRCNEKIIPEFLAIYLNSNEAQSYIMGTQVGMTRQGLNYSQIRAMPIPVPEVKEQNEIVRRVESLFAVADRIEASYHTLQEKIDHLPQAILSKAFRGELVTRS